MSHMPVLFIGHGSPMNAIADNDYTKALGSIGQTLPKPKAILMISAHWMTRGTFVTHMAKPKTIHDFYGFPKELFEIQYPAPGSPEFADLIAREVSQPKIGLDDSEWGFDHGAWSVLRHLYPDANIPVVQLSLDMSRGPEHHFQIGQNISHLRDQGYLLIGSGNVVHNLRAMNWKENARPHDWAMEYDEWIKSNIMDQNYFPLVNEATSNLAGKLSNPSMDHYYPLLSILGAATKQDSPSFFFEGIQNASLSMRSLILN